MPHAESPHPPPPFAELYCRSCFSFLTGASHPDELLTQAASLGYTALAITDECSLAGMVRAYATWQQQQGAIQLIVGTHLQLADGPGLVLLATDRSSYGHLSSLITRGRRAAEESRRARIVALAQRAHAQPPHQREEQREPERHDGYSYSTVVLLQGAHFNFARTLFPQTVHRSQRCFHCGHRRHSV